MRRSVHLFAVLAASTALAACSSPAETVDCPAGTQLTTAGCATTCSRSEDCLLGESCVSGACVVDGNVDPADGGGHADAITFPDAGFRDASEPLDLGVKACTRREDCGMRMDGEWSECDFVEPCGETGKRYRTVSIPFCDRNNLCAVEERQEMVDCMPRSTSGNVCAPEEVGEFGECYNEAECSSQGMKKRDITVYKCEAAECRPEMREDHQPCARNVENAPCGPIQMDLPPGPCLPVMECSQDGSQTYTTEFYGCRQEACVVINTSTFDSTCPLMIPDGTACGMDGLSQCCANNCVDKNDVNHCGVCFVSCDQNRGCEQINQPADPAHRLYACACRGNDECNDSGPQASCVGDLITTGNCSCHCGSATSPCAGECPVGLCYENTGFGTCRYP